MYGYFFGMSILWWFFWIVIIALFFALLVPVPRSRARELTRETPLDVLQRRYAAGEIDTAEYDERRRRLLADRGEVGQQSPPAATTRPPPPGPEQGEQLHH